MARSGGYSDGNLAEFWVQGSRLDVPTGRGFNMVALGDAGTVKTYGTFDMSNSTQREELVAFVAALANGTRVLVAVQDDARDGYTDEVQASLVTLGAKESLLADFHWRYSYALLGTKHGEAFAECMVAKEQGKAVAASIYGEGIPGIDIEVHSAGFQDGNAADISLDGSVYPLETNHGLNVIFLSPTRQVLSAQVFNPEQGGSDELIEAINALENFSIVIVAAKDDAKHMLSDEAEAALATCGATMMNDLHWRYSYALVGLKNGPALVETLSKPTEGDVTVSVRYGGPEGSFTWMLPSTVTETTTSTTLAPVCARYTCTDTELMHKADAATIGATNDASCCEPREEGVASIAIESAGWGNGNIADFYINGQKASVTTRRGINILALRETGAPKEVFTFDTWTSNEEGSDLLAEYIDGLVDGTIVLAAAKDEATRRLTEAAFVALESCGATKIRNITYRGAYALIGVKGGKALSEGLASDGEGSTFASAQIEVAAPNLAVALPLCPARSANPPVKGWMSGEQFKLEAGCRYELFESAGAAECLANSWVVVIGGSNTVLMAIRLANMLADQAILPTRDGATMGGFTLIDLIIKDGAKTYFSALKFDECGAPPHSEACSALIYDAVGKAPAAGEGETRITLFSAQFWDHAQTAMGAVTAQGLTWLETKMSFLVQISTWDIYCAGMKVTWCPREGLNDESLSLPAAVELFNDAMIPVVEDLAANYCAEGKPAAALGCNILTSTFQNPAASRIPMYEEYNDAIRAAHAAHASDILRLLDVWVMGQAMPDENILGHGSPMLNLWNWQVMLSGMCAADYAAEGTVAKFEGELCTGAEAKRNAEHMMKCPVYKEECPNTWRCEPWECANSLPCVLVAVKSGPPKDVEGMCQESLTFEMASATSASHGEQACHNALYCVSGIEWVPALVAGGLALILLWYPTLLGPFKKLMPKRLFRKAAPAAKVQADESKAAVAVEPREVAVAAKEYKTEMTSAETADRGDTRSHTLGTGTCTAGTDESGASEPPQADEEAKASGDFVTSPAPMERPEAPPAQEMPTMMMGNSPAKSGGSPAAGAAEKVECSPISMPPEIAEERPSSEVNATVPTKTKLDTEARCDELLSVSVDVPPAASDSQEDVKLGEAAEENLGSQSPGLPCLLGGKDVHPDDTKEKLSATPSACDACDVNDKNQEILAEDCLPETAIAAEPKKPNAIVCQAQRLKRAWDGRRKAGDKFPLGLARFCASLHVVIGHVYAKGITDKVYWFGWGFTWVPWFFMLSGFVLFNAHLKRPKEEGIFDYVLRRSVSIYPLYAFSLLPAVVTARYLGHMPPLNVLIAQSFLVQAWWPGWTELSLQSHCWFLSAMVVYWLLFKPLSRCLQNLGFISTISMMTALFALPWLVIWVPMLIDEPLKWYSAHSWGQTSTALDLFVVALKFHPACYLHVFVLGMLLAKLRLLLDGQAKKSSRPWLYTFPMEFVAPLGYLGLILVFTQEPLRPWAFKLSARLSVLLPFQAMVLLGLAGLPNMPVGAAALFASQFNFFENYSYAVYVFQFICYSFWPERGHIDLGLFLIFCVGTAFTLSILVQGRIQKWWSSHPKARLAVPFVMSAIMIAAVYWPEGEKPVDPEVPTLVRHDPRMIDVELPLVDSEGSSMGLLMNPSFAVNESRLVVTARRHKLEVSFRNGWYNWSAATIQDQTWVSSVLLGETVLDGAAWNAWPTSGVSPFEVTLTPWYWLRTETDQRWRHLCTPEEYDATNNTVIRHVVTGPEDAKAFFHNGNVSVSFDSFPPNGQEGCAMGQDVPQMYMSRNVAVDGDEFNVGKHLECGADDAPEKNWIPFEYESETYMVYRPEPQQVLKIAEDGTCQNLYSSSFEPLAKLLSAYPQAEIRGSGQAVFVNATNSTPNLARPHYLAAFHIYDTRNKTYAHFAYRFAHQPPFNVLQVSSQLDLVEARATDTPSKPFAFVSGLALVNDTVAIAYGSGDRAARALVMTLPRLDDMFACEPDVAGSNSTNTSTVDGDDDSASS